ncbi:hypothetical protein BGZ51_008465 [Haplosporangium sp. Z 767]|nr:hypothetical protein BGZ51_008465 [Haplosporangium sp. Z 767]KAF9194619.1 hypothetical protein BGZ50_005980 [Haplosporangium sp. Z 11]
MVHALNGTVSTTATTAATTTSQHSLRQLVRNQITEYSRLTQALFTSLDALADGKAASTSPNDIMKQIVQLDATLMGAVEKIESHQIQQRRIRQVQQEIEEQNKAIMTVIQNLRDAKQVLESDLENLEEKRAASAEARLAEVSVSEIVAYANRLSNYTSAPPNFNPSDPNQPFEPPYPREVNMRAGILNQQHIPAAALVSLDEGFMPGTTLQPGQALPGAGKGAESGPDGLPPGAMGVLGNNIHSLSNGRPHDIMEDDDESGSSSEEEGLSYRRVMEEERMRQEEQQQQQQQQEATEQPPDDDIFDLDLN